uniref:Coat protein n=1 Tax=Conidiobolus chlamydosporus totivirus 3 TaxID=2980977 RepID=A0A977R5H3_9VIRU|nr:coat protein [Conidiobolus chlamydosporus totivirus 3]
MQVSNNLSYGEPTHNRSDASMLFGALGRSMCVTLPNSETELAESSAQPANYRRYMADLTSRSPLTGNLDYWTRGIVYQVGNRGNNATDLLTVNPEIEAPLASIDTSEIHAAEFSGLARRYSSFSGLWARSDLSGIAEQLAAGVAVYAQTGSLSLSQLRGGRPISVTALGAVLEPVAASSSQVFIARTADTIMSPNVFSAVCAAANAYGAHVVTDVIQVDANSQSALMPTCENADLAFAAIEGMRLLMSNYARVGAESMIAYAIVRGVHRIVSVVGHSDEGSIFRDVLRCRRFATPFGGIRLEDNTAVALPRLSARTREAAANWTDAIALISAASVAHCDPCISHRGNVFPTVLNSDLDTAGDDPSDINVGTAADARRLTALLADDMPRFAPIWARALAKLFGLPGGVHGPMIDHLCAAARGVANCDLRHARFKAMAPYFWIEPTSLIPPHAFGTLAEQSGFGSVAHARQGSTLAGWESCKRIGGSGMVGVYHVKQRTARTSAMLMHLSGNPRDGLASLTIRQANPHDFALLGAGPDPSRSTSERMLAHEGLDSYMWGRGQSPLPAPAELINVAGSMYMGAVHANTDYETFISKPTHIPAPDYMSSISVDFNVSLPRGIPPGPLGPATKEVCRQRSRGLQALEAARFSALPMFSGEAFDFPVRLQGVDDTPMGEIDTSRRPALPEGQVDDGRFAPGEARGSDSLPASVQRGATTERVGGQMAGVRTAGGERGPTLPPTIAHGTRAGPRPGDAPRAPIGSAPNLPQVVLQPTPQEEMSGDVPEGTNA